MMMLLAEQYHLKTSTIVNEAIGVASAEVAVPTDAHIIEVGASTDCWISFGSVGGSVSNSTGFFFPKGVAVYALTQSQTHIRFIRDTADGRISITQLI